MGEGSAEMLLCFAVDVVEAVSRGQCAWVSLLVRSALVQILSFPPPSPTTSTGTKPLLKDIHYTMPQPLSSWGRTEDPASGAASAESTTVQATELPWHSRRCGCRPKGIRVGDHICAGANCMHVRLCGLPPNPTQE